MRDWSSDVCSADLYGDVIEGVDFDYVAKLTALNAVSLAGMASAPPPPADVSIEGAVPADTTLKWARPTAMQAPHPAGHSIHWQLTPEPQWTPSVYVSNAAQPPQGNGMVDKIACGGSA